MNLAPGIPPIKADLQELRENLFRLVVEARDRMPDGGVVEVSSMTTESADGARGVRVAIRDTGKSIRANAKDRVFDPYYQSRSGNRNAGFALALVYQFVALSGGSIEAQKYTGGSRISADFPGGGQFAHRAGDEPSAAPASGIA